MSTSTSTPKIFRVTVEVSNLEDAAAFYVKLLDTRASGTRARGTTSTAGASSSRCSTSRKAA
jgi:hypothetical protein